ncbi:MAG: phosphate signaling complex protein PhoU [Pseudomonadota bacterium]
MKYYEERLENDLAAIRTAVKDMGGRVQETVKDAVHALLTGNRRLSNKTILNDGYINRDMRRINHLCHTFVARHQPSAGHLRRISSVLLANISLERIGDYAVTICREQKQLREPPQGALARDIELLANDSRAMLRQAMTAFEQENADLAKGTVIMADQIEHTFAHIFPDLLALGEQNECDLKEIFALLSALNFLERISDQAKNICEEAVFLVTGEEKPFKIYNILFMDERNDSLSPMAEAIARKAFPGSGIYTSRGRHPAETLHTGMVDFMHRHGYDFTDVRPRSLGLSPVELEDFHVIASLGGLVASYIGNVPFHTIDLQWELPVPPLEGKGEDSVWEEIFQQLFLNIDQLMEALRGKEAP